MPVQIGGTEHCSEFGVTPTGFHLLFFYNRTCVCICVEDFFIKGVLMIYLS